VHRRNTYLISFGIDWKANVVNQIISDDSWDARYYILQCEEIVREIGQQKPLFSEKSTKLHQIMMFVRIFEQSTFLQTKDQYAEKLAASYTPVTEKVNLLEFMPGGSSSLSRHSIQDPLSLQEMGLDGTTQAQRFLDIYGFDLQLLLFISRTTKLAGLLDDIVSRAPNDGLPSSDLVQEAATLEEEICKWTSKSQILDSSESADSPSDTGMHHPPTVSSVDSINQMRVCLTSAIHEALIIYFFRCVRLTNPVILQQYVTGVLDNLERHNQLQREHFPKSKLGTIVWPAFIAACDALSPELRARALGCLRQAKTGGFRNAETAERVVKELWRQREEGAIGVGWRDIIREMNVTMVLT
jgi:arginine metabolism regulation protein II